MFNFSDVQEKSTMAPELRKKDCSFLGVERIKDEKNPQNNNAIAFKFIHLPTRGMLTHREFVPKSLPGQSTEDFKKTIELSVQRMAHIARAFVTQEEFDSIKVADPNNMALVEDNFISVTNQVGKLLMNKVKANSEKPGSFDLNCELKVVLRESKGKYYSSFPAVPPFISTKNHPKEFTLNPQYDILVAPVARPDAEKRNIPTQERDDFGGGFTTQAAPATQTAPDINTAPSNHDSGF